jgi:hypothetical protein
MWREVIFLHFQNFLMEKDDVAYSLNFQKYFVMNKDDMA